VEIGVHGLYKPEWSGLDSLVKELDKDEGYPKPTRISI
jgi:hypothetical protein